MNLGKILGLGLGLMLWLYPAGWVQAAPPGTSLTLGDVPPVSSVTGEPGMEEQGDLAAEVGDRCLNLVQLGRYQTAIAACSQAIQLDEQRPEPWLNRGLAFYRTGHFPQALADDTAVLTRHPQDFRGYYNRGLVQVALHDFEAAIADFDQAATLTADPNPLVDIYDDRGLAKLMAAHPQAALRDFEAALDLDAQDTRAWFNHSCACHQMGRLAEAIADLDQVLMLDPSHVHTYLKRGLIRRSLGDAPGAIADLHQAANCARSQGQPQLHHYILTLLNEWQTSTAAVG
ncbi:tetratricopeptide repeat protein [Nodosilinea sp. P-1105]|uniref:tetratricopeptide repeat protein n=1 Tax=Nodosilinea sp. P-1105 TaxID=2546229 RepID=UPI00146DE8F0|nr:tetratricopeptide repeat protein [Nodosilinea sp. P-1105]NMF86540.1 tetratricopeptide repeat protein [Nodosilinea sp. P-1105]